MVEPKSDFDPQAFVKTLPTLPGVYKMLSGENEVIYVGKAKNLKNRVGSYFVKQDHSPKNRVMIKQIRSIETVVTNTEAEALLLENQFIKEYKPRYNLLFRDDKSYPYIFLSDEKFPRLSFHRGAKKQKGRYFGPFPSSSAVRYSLSLMQKLFQIRQCENSVFKNRSRPCLQYQIKRCSGSCVGKISEEDYAGDVSLVKQFYEGKNDEIIKALQSRMEEASNALAFEKAAHYRDQIVELRKIVSKQVISGVEINADVIAAGVQNKLPAIYLLMIRNGQIQSSRQYFPKARFDVSEAELVESFISQQYTINESLPQEIIVNQPIATNEFAEALSNIHQRKVRITDKVRGPRADWLKLAETNVNQALELKLKSKAQVQQRLIALSDLLQLDNLPMRMECFDISHLSGQQTVASCVVFVAGEPRKAEYRKFNISGIQPGDDYAAMEQAVRRRFKRLAKGEGKMPDILFIDGGKGQLAQAEKILGELEIEQMTLVGVAKGSDRKAGLEQLFLSGNALPLKVNADDLGLTLIQYIRDESHRFAIVGHRAQRTKVKSTSPLESIAGVGPKKRKALINHFGGLQEIRSASIDDLVKVEGINRKIAEAIYESLHE